MKPVSSSVRESNLRGTFRDRAFMELALRQAEAAAAAGEVPVGAVIADSQGNVLSSAHNETEALADPTAHAEILAIRRAAEKTGDWRLSGCVLYVTLEPCIMCAGAAVNSRIETVVFGAYDSESGSPPGKEVCRRGGVMEECCSDLLRGFFSGLRRKEGS